MMEGIFEPQARIALSTLTALEIVLGIDNIIFISVPVGRLPERQRQRAHYRVDNGHGHADIASFSPSPRSCASAGPCLPLGCMPFPAAT